MALWQQLRLAGLGTIFLGSWIVVIATGCSFPLQQGPSDLRLVKVELVDCRGLQDCYTRQPGRKVLLITLETHRDLGADFEDTGTLARVDARTCSRGSPATKIYMEAPQFWRVDPYELLIKGDQAVAAARAAAQPQKGQPYLYRIWFDYKSSRSDFGFGAYDLLENPQNVCLAILGTPAFGVGYGVSTNEVVVPRDSIATALKSSLP
jgi:hypothetical protein